jgi:hypothetical protein
MSTIVTAGTVPNTAHAPALAVNKAAAATTYTVRAAAVASVGVPTKAEFDVVVDLVNDLRQLLINAGIGK